MNEKQEQTLRKIAKRTVINMLSKKDEYEVIEDLVKLSEKVSKGGTDYQFILLMAQEVGKLSQVK